MKPFHEYMNEYRKQMEKGDIKEAYRGLMEYIMELRTYFNKLIVNYIIYHTIRVHHGKDNA